MKDAMSKLAGIEQVMNNTVNQICVSHRSRLSKLMLNLTYD